ncbi:porin family protein [Bradyrhizobium japonicum]|jgi:outer membrane immunogenic protein|uniref:outer membrane protein n=1 Tax=Bradyrhizobium japonicum TaxID=375 RepID=UPI001BA54CFC|nr:outer membrane beta-barrel protein [Bradyrhizobium japonicum]MBR0993836.1 porin family protein [Bradyrhizobium japonicum]
MKKNLLLAAVSLVALSATAPALAADLAARPYTKAPPMVAAIYDWSGFYVGVNGGWGQTRDRRSFDPTGTLLGSYDTDGATVGGQVGYRWQSGQWVFGLEAQGNWADISGSTANLVAPGTVRSKLDAFGLFTGQVGYAWNNVLIYVKGGAAITDRNYQFLTPGGAVLAETGYDTRLGGTVGAGLEYGFAPNWSIGVEYNHIFENRHAVTFTGGGVSTTGFSSGGDTDLILGRLNYKFGGPGLARF